MNSIFKELNDAINESVDGKQGFRKEKLSDGSMLISNKMESIFNRIDTPNAFFLHRPAYFFNKDISETLYKNNDMIIRTYIKAAYLDYMSNEYDAIVRNTDILIDEKYSDTLDTDRVRLGIIYSDEHSINDSKVRLNSDTRVNKIIDTTIFEANRYFGKKIKYINMDEFIDQINSNYTKALDLLKGVLNSDEFKHMYITGAIDTTFINKLISFDSSKYNSIPICTIDASHLDIDTYTEIEHEVSNNICREINNKLIDEFFISADCNDRIIAISVNYKESLSESVHITNKWNDLFYGNYVYLESK